MCHFLRCWHKHTHGLKCIISKAIYKRIKFNYPFNVVPVVAEAEHDHKSRALPVRYAQKWRFHAKSGATVWSGCINQASFLNGGEPLDATYLSAPSVVLDDGCQPKAQSVRARPSQSVTSIKPNAAAMIKSYVYTKLPSQRRDTLHRLRFVLFMG